MSGYELDFLHALIASAAHGAEHAAEHGGEHHGTDWVLVVSLFFNVGVLFAVLIWKAGPAISKALVARRANMAVALEQAAKKQAAAEARLSEYQEKLDNLEREVAKVVESYEREAAHDRAKIEAETDKAIERLERETSFTIQQKTLEAERMIKDAAVEATLEAAEQKIRSRIADADHARLTERYIESLGENRS